MMKLLEYEVTPYDTDYFRCVSPANYLKMMESAGFIALETYGLEMQQMEYMRECRAGETLTLYSNRETPGTTYVVGKRQDGSDAFRACLEMEADAI